MRPSELNAGEAQAPSTGELVTFDVFETLLVRALSPAAAVFDHLGERALRRGLIAMPAHAFGKAREWAERRANQSGGDHVTLDDIHAELAFALRLSPAQEAALKALELEVEAELLRPVPSVLPLVERARARAGRLVYVSDMYLPAAFIEAQLRRHGFWRPGDALYVSHAHGCCKRTGKLFAAVAARENVDVRRILHYGNHAASDVAGAERARAKGVLTPAGNPNRYETALQRYREGSQNLTAAFAGASRLARLSTPAAGADQSALTGVAAGVIGPAMTAYLLWALQRAQALGLQRLYFVARDGEVLLQMARGLAPKLGCAIELRYLYGSRMVWNRATDAARSPEAWHSLIWQSKEGVSNRELLERTGIGRAAVDALIRTPADRAAWESSDDREVLKQALAELQAAGAFDAVVRENRRVLTSYLEQEGLFDGGAHGFVDLGWRGTQHDVLLELQKERGVPPAHGLFFGLEDSACRWAELREAYLFDGRPRPGEAANGTPRAWRLGVPETRSQFSLHELFCSGSHGTLVGYETRGGRIEPVLRPGREAEMERWGLPQVRRTLERFVHHLHLDADRDYASIDARQALIHVTEIFRTSPTRDEARAWGSFPWEIGQGERLRAIDFAPARDFDRFRERQAMALRLIPRRPEATQWGEASFRRSPALMNWACFPVNSLWRFKQRVTKAARRLRLG